MSSFKQIIITGNNSNTFNKYMFKINNKGTRGTSMVVLKSLLLAVKSICPQ